MTKEGIPIAELLVLRGLLKRQQVRILKDDGCNTNIISKAFYERHKHAFQVEDVHVVISHSKENTTERATKSVKNATLFIAGIPYTSNWAIASCRYDVLVGMLWHRDMNPKVDYEGRQVTVNNTTLPLETVTQDGEIRITNINAKKFKSFLRKKNESSYQIHSVSMRERTDFTSSTSSTQEEKVQDAQADIGKNHRLDKLLQRFAHVFRNDLPARLPPERVVDHRIETQDGEKPPHRPLFQLSPAELLATKEYITDLLRKGKIRPSKSPYGAPLFFVKQKGSLRGVIDYRALYRITKKNHSPIIRIEEMFDRLGGSEVFSKMDLKSGYH